MKDVLAFFYVLAGLILTLALCIGVGYLAPQ